MRRYKNPEQSVSFTIFRIIPKHGEVRIGKTKTREFEEQYKKYLMHGYDIEVIKEINEKI